MDEELSSIEIENLTASPTEEMAQQEEIVLATIAGVTADGVTILIDGETTAGAKVYKVNAGQLFQVGDRVKTHKNSGTYLIEYVIGSPMARYPVPSGGSDGQVLTKDGGTDYAVKWATPHGIPAGGNSGQVLEKSSGTDYATEWSTPHYLPSGGTKDQVLAKTSSTNYEVSWVSPSHDLPSGGSSGQVLTKDGSADYSVKWADAPHELPTGGTNGQVLTKDGSSNYSVKWANAPSPTALSNGSYTVTCANNGYFYPSSGTIALGASSGYWNGCYLKGSMRFGDSAYSPNAIGFFGTTPQSKKSVGSSGTLAQLISALQGYGLIS